jgi:hypothetical protein
MTVEKLIRKLKKAIKKGLNPQTHVTLTVSYDDLDYSGELIHAKKRKKRFQLSALTDDEQP